MKTVGLGLLIVVFLIPGCHADRDGEWGGSVAVEGGIEVVSNPDRPIYSDHVVTIEEDLSIGGARSSGEQMLTGIVEFSIDDQGLFYILDTKPLRVKVFDGTGHFLRSFGREGEGPGEFQSVDGIQITSNGRLMLTDAMSGRILYFSDEGGYRSYLKCPELRWSSQTSLSSESRIYSIVLSAGEMREKLITLFPPYEEAEVIASRPVPLGGPLPAVWLRYSLLPEGRIVWGITSAYELHIIDDSGRTVRRIHKDHTPVPLSDDYRAAMSELAPPGRSKEKWAASITDRFSSHFPAFDFFFADDEGRLFVKTFEKHPAGDGYIVDIFDPTGRFLARMSLRADPFVRGNWPHLYTVKKNFLYAPEYDADGFPVLKRYRMVWREPLSGVPPDTFQ